MDADKKVNVEAIKQYLKDKSMVEVYKADKEKGCASTTEAYILFLRAQDIIEKLSDEINEILFLPNNKIFPEIERVIPNPAICTCTNFPREIFSVGDKMFLLHEGIAIYGDLRDEDSLELQLKDIVHRAIDNLSETEKEILQLSLDYEGYYEDEKWFEYYLLHCLPIYEERFYYKETLEKFKKYDQQGLWLNGKKLTPEEMNVIGKGGFSDVAGMNNLKAQLQTNVIDVIREPNRAKALGISLPNGLLLYGPPGCGKTFIAQKLAEETGCHLVTVNCSDIASTFLHGTQLEIAKKFGEAEKNKPSIVFFDEIDAMIPKRNALGAEYYKTEVNEFLTQLNNCGKRGIIAIGATNRPQDVDEAALRSGRLETKVFLPAPDSETRTSLFIQKLKSCTIKGIINIDEFVGMTEGWISSDIAMVVDQTARLAFSRKLDYIDADILREVVSKFKPTITKSQLKEYDDIRDRFEGRKQERPRIGFC